MVYPVDFEDNISALYFQLVRKKKDETFDDIRNTYQTLVDNAVTSHRTFHINILLSLLFQTRDIRNGKGEYTLFYNLLTVWDSHWSEIGDKLTKGLSLVLDSQRTNVVYDQQFDSPYGSWKDVKYILNHYKNFYKMNKYAFIKLVQVPGIINTLVQFVVRAKESNDMSLLVRWLPRESSNKFGWQSSIFACALFPSVKINTALRNYRDYCASGNKELCTTQVLQCSKNWKDIVFDTHVTVLTLARQKRAFLYKNKPHYDDDDDDSDRRECASSFNSYLISSAVLNATKFELDDSHRIEDIFHNTVILMDNSLSSSRDVVETAITIACASGLGKQILTFNKRLCLENCETLNDMVGLVRQTNFGENTNSYTTYELIAEECLRQDLSPTVVNSAVFVVISDITPDINNVVLHEMVSRLFQETGMKTSYCRPYSKPTVVFWNMCRSSMFPVSSSINNTTIITGYTNASLAEVMRYGFCELENTTQWSHIYDILVEERYSWFW